jgi:glycosyltransferase involved in cell wall biosynthesis
VAEEENKQHTRPPHRQGQRGFDRRRSKSPSHPQGDSAQNDISAPSEDTGRRQERSDNYAPAPRAHSQKHQSQPDKNQNVAPLNPGRHHQSQVNVSVVIPLLNEEESLPELAAQLKKVLAVAAKEKYEVIFIDDGSTDGSFQVIRDLHRKDSRFHAIRFRRNYGKSAALAVGFAEAKGEVVITMDADLQDDPAEIPHLIDKLREGYDLVSGWKKKRHDPFHKTIPSRFFNFVTSKASGIKLHDFNCGLKGYRKEVVKTLQVYGEMHRYLPALAHWDGFRVTEIPVTHHARRFGKSKFGFSRFFKGFLDLLTVLFTTRYVKRPLHLFGTAGTLLSLVGFGTDLYLTIEWAMGKTSLSNRPLALFGVALIIVGVQLICFGLIGELLVKNFQKNVEYSVRERL